MSKSECVFMQFLLKGPPGIERSAAALKGILELRNWERLSIKWDEQAGGFAISTQFEGSNVSLIAKHFQEELFESACAVLESVEGLRVEIVEAALMPKDLH